MSITNVCFTCTLIFTGDFEAQVSHVRLYGVMLHVYFWDEVPSKITAAPRVK